MFWKVAPQRDFDNAIRNTPDDVGPGKYEILQQIGNFKTMKAPFGFNTDRNCFPLLNGITPSPGDYEAKPIGDSIKITSVFNSGSKRDVFPANDLPSPDKHSQIVNWIQKKNKNVSKSRKVKARSTTFFVGQDVYGYIPDEYGNYIPNKIKKKGIEWIGPGTYDPKIPSVQREFHFHGTKKGIFDTGDKSFPGPGAYTPKNENRRLKTQIGKVIPKRELETNNFTCIGQEEWGKHGRSASACFKSNAERDIFRDTRNNPSPTQYNQMFKLLPEKPNAEVCFGSRMERKLNLPLSDTPGPGQYNQKGIQWIRSGSSNTNRAPKSSIFVSNSNPGPADYNTTEGENIRLEKALRKADSVFQSRSRRGQVIRGITPGPGAYDTENTYSSAQIHPQIRETRYDKVGNWIDMSKSNNPSPDRYQKLGEVEGIEQTIRHVERFNYKYSDVPGPGRYDIKHGSLLIKSHNINAPRLSDHY